MTYDADVDVTHSRTSWQPPRYLIRHDPAERRRLTLYAAVCLIVALLLIFA